jgi:hypothetical protein
MKTYVLWGLTEDLVAAGIRDDIRVVRNDANDLMFGLVTLTPMQVLKMRIQIAKHNLITGDKFRLLTSF